MKTTYVMSFATFAALALTFVTASHAQEIACGQTITNRLSIAGQTDTYTFTADAGQAILIGAIATTFNCVADVYDPNGVRIGSCTNGYYFASAILTNSGNYTILVHDRSYSFVGNYGLSLSFTTGQCGTELTWAILATNRITLLGQVDSYTFYGNTGEVAVVNFSGSGITPAWSVFGPTGASYTNGFGNGATAPLTLTNTGIYTIVVGSYYYGGTGSYSLGVSFVHLVPASYRLSISATNDATVLRLWGQVGRMTTLQCETNVAATNGWFALTNLILPWSPYRFVDLDSTNSPQRFYRTEQ